MELSQCILKASKCSTHSNKIITTGYKNSCHQVQSATNKLLLGNQLATFGLQIKNFLQTSVALPVMYGKYATMPKRKKKKNNLKNMIALIMIGESVLISHIQLIWEVQNCFQAQVFFLKMLHKDFLEIAIYQHLWPQWQNTRTESKSFSKARKLIRMDLMMLSFTWMVDGYKSEINVQDLFLTSNDDKPTFCRTTNGSTWHMFVEKAYAKFYGSYAAIESG